ncbi:MAG TPA: MotA/TolQ/ExbB proton channel family protein [Verrucomicrobiota bacterium]|nr:MotA/TolQ/ExbB proton channel family protein [Verrucomicrobiota bacterium]HNT15527.1 MotA/TolQ/ExbB proton channel family protein [Verrucomicrobiota bacterium]
METIVYVLLFITSVIGLAFIVERGLALRWKKVVPPEIETAVRNCESRAATSPLQRACERNPSSLGRLLLVLTQQLEWPREENEAALQTRARHEIVKLERGLVVLEIIVGIAPLLGLVGTIVGMMDTFEDVGLSGLNDAAKLAHGISMILKATLIGLLIAIPALVAWSYYSKKVEMLAVEMETLCDELLHRLYRN